MSYRRSHKKSRDDRKKHSSKVQSELIYLINDNQESSTELKNNALSKLLSLNRKHRLKMPKEVNLLFCKQCKKLHNVTNTRVRIKHGQTIISCLTCDFVRRLGGGPKSHRSDSNV